MKPRAVPERSRRHFPRKAAKSLQKSSKRLQKSTKRLPKMTPKTCLKSKKTVWVPLFPHQKNDDNLEAVFSRFLAPAVGPDLAKSSQNTVRVCKNEGPTFSRKTAFSYKNSPKMSPLGPPETPKNWQSVYFRGLENRTKKNMKKGHANEKEIVAGNRR